MEIYIILTYDRIYIFKTYFLFSKEFDINFNFFFTTHTYAIKELNIVHVFKLTTKNGCYYVVQPMVL